MKILLILFLCSIQAISTSNEIIDNDSDENTSASSNSTPTRHRLPIYPKNRKFVIKPHKYDTDSKREFLDSSEEIKTRKPLMVKMIPKYNKNSVTTAAPVTRRPLMKFRTYTVKINSRGKGTIENIDGEKQNYKQRSLNKAIDGNTVRKDKKVLSKMNMSKEKVENKVLADTFHKRSESKNIKEITKEEQQDRNEFIFLEPKNKNIVINDLLSVDEDDFETTTNRLDETEIRHKRGSNIIEEENMGTTISALRYTGRDTRLTNELYFKNINH